METPDHLRSMWHWFAEGHRYLLLTPLAVALAALAAYFPASGDDWAWGSNEGTERLREHFAGYNGRYAGNLAVLVLTRAHLLTPLLVGLVLCLVVVLVARLGRQDDLPGLTLAAALVLAMPLGQWRQTVAWTSGFSNYMLAGVILLVFAVVALGDLDSRVRMGPVRAVVAGGFAFVGQLFMEHVTMFIVVAAVAWVVVPAWRSRRRPSALSVTWLVAAVAGAAVMFTNSAYRAAAAGDPGYQSIGPSDPTTSSTDVLAIARQGLHGVSQYAVASNTVLNAALLAVVIGLAWSARQRAPLTWGQWLSVALVLVGQVAGAAVLASVEPTHYFGSLTRWAWLSSGAMFVGLLLTARFLVEQRDRATRVALLAVAVLLLSAPMAAVTPYGPRNFLPGYLLMVAIAVTLVAELRERVGQLPLTPMATAIATTVVLAVLGHYFAVYAAIQQQSEVRLAAIQHAVDDGDRKVQVWTLPYPEYVHVGDPVPGAWQERFLAYHHLPAWLKIQLQDRYARRDLVASQSD